MVFDCCNAFLYEEIEGAEPVARANDHSCHGSCSEQHAPRQLRSWLILNVRQKMKDPALVSGVSENRENKAFRFKRGMHGDQVYFSYAHGKQRAEALEAANAFAADYLAKHGPPQPVSYKGKMTKSNRSGRPGVHPKSNWNRTRDRRYWYWGTVWPGVRSGPMFSLLIWDDDVAFVLASIACDLETFDKEFIELEYSRYLREGKVPAILAKKKLSLPPDE